MGAYRFFGNESAYWRAIMAPHWQQTQQSMQAQPVVLCLQDTTELDFKGNGAIGLGTLSYEAQRGMDLHPQREPLGVLDAWMWARYLLTSVKQPAKPTLNEVLRLIARLGRFLGRKSDGEPGVKTTWLGLKEVHIATKTLRGLRAADDGDNCV